MIAAQEEREYFDIVKLIAQHPKTNLDIRNNNKKTVFEITKSFNIGDVLKKAQETKANATPAAEIQTEPAQTTAVAPSGSMGGSTRGAVTTAGLRLPRKKAGQARHHHR
jgi:hypothetical protein